MRNILFIHQSAEMYGSDKVLLSLVDGLDRNKFNPIVILPRNGPLLLALRENGIECHICPIVCVGRSTLHINKLINLPIAIWQSIRAINKAVQQEPIHLVHSNTLAVLSGAMWAKLKGVPHVWHVHEIIVTPIIVRKFFSLMLRLFATKVISVSKATEHQLLIDQPSLIKKSVVVWNGIQREHGIDPAKSIAFRRSIGVPDTDVLITLLGRINRWKGQLLLVEAAEILEERGIKNIRYAMIGSPVQGQEHLLHSLNKMINESLVRGKISVLQYTSEIWTAWDACDIAVVPSTEPEPFGMVALEAMAATKPVVAANHGGLAEIVVHEQTGLLFEPCNAVALANALESLVKDKDQRNAMGAMGRLRVSSEFSVASYISRITLVYEDVTS